jgi:hypothetical protein
MKSKIVLAVVIVGASFGVARAAEIVVVQSTSPRYVAGQTLDAAAPLMIAAGESVTVVTESARLIKMDGPHNGPAAGPAPDPSGVRRALAQLIVEERPGVGGVGGVRGDSLGEQAPDTRPDPWLVHAARNGDQCVVRDRPVGVWREEAGKALVVDVGISLSERTEQIRWDAGQQRAAWPAATTLTDDTVYLLRSAASLRSVPIRLHLLDPALAGGDGLAAAAWLAAKGCIDQARVVLRASPAPG